MNEDDFKKLYEGYFTAPDPNDPLIKLADEYHQRCDTYDAEVCSGRHHGDPFPATQEERRAITRHALAVLKEVKDKALMAGFTSEQLHEAIRERFR